MSVSWRFVALVAATVAVGVGGWSLVRVNALQSQRDRDQVHQLANRVKNVWTWCSAINEGRDYNRLRARDRGRVDPLTKPYALDNLDCADLALVTAKSGSAGQEIPKSVLEAAEKGPS